MTKIQHLGTIPYSAEGRGEALRPTWPHGEVREVSEDDALYLLADFPGRFVAVGGTLPPPVDRAVKAPPVARSKRS